MRTTCPILLAALLFTTLALEPFLVAAGSSKKDSTKDSTVTAIEHVNNATDMRIQGEQRFRANCGRCHAAPQKFPPRMMKTVLRHMRVRATITDEDMRMVLFYMTQ